MASQSLNPDTTIRHYLIQRVLGKGSYGITYLATDLEKDKPVAIKEYFPMRFAARGEGGTVRAIQPAADDIEDFDSGLVKFLEEAETLSRFRDEHIVEVFDWFEHNGTAYMVMRYEEGWTLSRYLSAHPDAIEEADVLSIFVPLLEGLRTVHAKWFLHRDIKPDNIYIRRDGEPLLIDFGTARHAASAKRGGMTEYLTPGYAPPEQYDRRADHGPWTDIYALGATMYHCVTRLVPQAGRERQFALIESGSDPLVSAIRAAPPIYRKGFLEIIDWMMEPDHTNRPQSVDDVLVRLRSLPPEDRDDSDSTTADAEQAGATVPPVTAAAVDAEATTVPQNSGQPAADSAARTTAAEGPEPPTLDAAMRDTKPMPAQFDAPRGETTTELPDLPPAPLASASIGDENDGAASLPGEEHAASTGRSIRARAGDPRLWALVAAVALSTAAALWWLGPDDPPQTTTAVRPPPTEPTPRPLPDADATQIADTTRCAKLLGSGPVSGPAAEQAVVCYRAVLAAQPRNKAALDAIDSIEFALLEEVQNALAAGDYAGAKQITDKIQSLGLGDAPEGNLSRLDVPQTRRTEPPPAPAPERPRSVGRSSSTEPGELVRDPLKDGGTGPAMIVIPAGRFVMGCANRPECSNDQQPARNVEVEQPFLASRFEVTFDDYDRFATATGQPLPDDAGWGRGTRPVINITFNDAQAYSRWLRNQTGYPYRLLSEAEWEYVARAGGEQIYFFGDDESELCRFGNHADLSFKVDWHNLRCSDGFGEQTAPAGTFAANPWKVADTIGNVWEWVADCWHENYRRAPAISVPWLTRGGGNCRRHVIRGGSWYDGPGMLRPGVRNWAKTAEKYNLLGFRVASDID